MSALQDMRVQVRDKRRVATCAEFGPRFLHSSGQAYKGGPASGVFVQITTEPPEDLPVPGAAYAFGIVEAAQARGDFDVLAERGRRLLRVHFKGDIAAGMRSLQDAVKRALG
jgi:transaldolase/glucose-6-phosphate isomerase